MNTIDPKKYYCKKTGREFQDGDYLKYWHFGWITAQYRADGPHPFHQLDVGDDEWMNNHFLHDAVYIDHEIKLGEGKGGELRFEKPDYE